MQWDPKLGVSIKAKINLLGPTTHEALEKRKSSWRNNGFSSQTKETLLSIVENAEGSLFNIACSIGTPNNPKTAANDFHNQELKLIWNRTAVIFSDDIPLWPITGKF